MKTRTVRLILTLLTLSLLLNFYFVYVATKETNPDAKVGQNEEVLPRVAKVVDGDTITLDTGETVRYIGIDTPEISGGAECFGPEAKTKNKELVEGKQVRLEKDVSETDRYGRLLRYTYVVSPEPDDASSEIFINDLLVKEGFANSSTYPPDIKHQDKLIASQKEARENGRGLWSKCVNTLGESTLFTDKDCSDFKTQREAQDFFVAEDGPAKDLHKLDNDRDGKVCTSLP